MVANATEQGGLLMRKCLVLVLAVMAMLVMVCLPGAAEEHKTVNLSNDHYYCSPGMERLGYYDECKAA